MYEQVGPEEVYVGGVVPTATTFVGSSSKGRKQVVSCKRPQLSLIAASQSFDVILSASTCTAVAIRLGFLEFLIFYVYLGAQLHGIPWVS